MRIYRLHIHICVHVYVHIYVHVYTHIRARSCIPILSRTVGAILVPQSIAYSGLMGLSPIHGLMSSLFPLLGRGQGTNTDVHMRHTCMYTYVNTIYIYFVCWSTLDRSLVVYAVFGVSPILSIGPDAATSILIGTAIAQIVSLSAATRMQEQMVTQCHVTHAS